MKLFSVATLALMAAAPAFANTTLTLDFEGSTSFSSVAEFYNGGTDGAGQTGVNRGVSFTGAVLALSNDGTGTGTNGDFFSHAPSPRTVMFATDASAVMNVAAGMVNEVSFYYSNQTPAFDIVKIFSGADGTGIELGTFSMNKNAQKNGCSDSAFCNWQKISVSFGGTAHSVSFGGNAGEIAYDNISITAVPEPQTYAMMMAGLLALGFMVRRRPS